MGNLINFNPLTSDLLSTAGGFVIALVILLGLYKLSKDFMNKFMTKLMEMGKDFIEAQQSQATSMAGLTVALTEVLNRDDKAHQELRILLKFISGEIKGIRENASVIPDIKDKMGKIDDIENMVADIPDMKETLRLMNLKGDSK